MKTLLIALLALTSFGLASTNAMAKGIAGRASNGGYGMAGCGLGSLVFKENNGLQILAATTNGTLGSQTFGITFGTSNCDLSGKLVSKEQVEHYIAANQNALKNDIARGNGEALNGLAELMGKKDSTAFNTHLKANYAKIFAKTDLSAKQITDNLFSVLN